MSTYGPCRTKPFLAKEITKVLRTSNNRFCFLQEERLLPVGGGGRPPIGGAAKRGEGIIDRVWQVRGRKTEHNVINI